MHKENKGVFMIVDFTMSSVAGNKLMCNGKSFRFCYEVRLWSVLSGYWTLSYCLV